MPEPLPWDEVLISVEHHPERSFQLPDGRLMPDLVYTVTEKAKERLRAGYMCCNCLGQWAHGPFPELCPDCYFPVKKEQGWMLAKQMYTDYGVVSPGIPLDREREHLARVAYVRKGSMTVPKGIKR